MAELAESVERTNEEVEKIKTLSKNADKASSTNRERTLELKKLFKTVENATRFNRSSWKRKHILAIKEVKGELVTVKLSNHNCNYTVLL